MDRPEEERKQGKKISLGLRKIRAHVAQQLGVNEEQARKTVDADYGKGYIFTKLPGYGNKRVIAKPRGHTEFVLADTHQEAGLTNIDLNAIVGEMNEEL
eukprot:4688690-Karenia_brevis.AAC.1